MELFTIIWLCTFPQMNLSAYMTDQELDILNDGRAVLKKNNRSGYHTIKPEYDYHCEFKGKRWYMSNAKRKTLDMPIYRYWGGF
jgi:hypothetical protein